MANPMKTTTMRNTLSTILLAGAWLGFANGVSAQVPGVNTPAPAVVPDPSRPNAATPAGPGTLLTDRPVDERALRSLAQTYAHRLQRRRSPVLWPPCSPTMAR